MYSGSVIPKVSIVSALMFKASAISASDEATQYVGKAKLRLTRRLPKLPKMLAASKLYARLLSFFSQTLYLFSCCRKHQLYAV